MDNLQNGGEKVTNIMLMPNSIADQNSQSSISDFIRKLHEEDASFLFKPFEFSNSKHYMDVIKFEFAVNEHIVKIDITNGSSSIIEAWSLGFSLFESTNLSFCVNRIYKNMLTYVGLN